MPAPAWQYHEPDHPGANFDALATARRCHRVYAVDLSAGMLRYAEKKSQARGVSNVEFL
ncbi:MAG: class I SAM-dependent methyltransferase [Methanothrix sp.]